MRQIARGLLAAVSWGVVAIPSPALAQQRYGEDGEDRFPPSDYIRQRDEQRQEREKRWERERIEVEQRNRALQESREREASELERARRELDERQQRSRQASPPRALPETPAPERGQQFRRTHRDADGLRCRARPYCPAGTGYANACKELSATVGRSSEMVGLCQRANNPEPCGAHLTGDPQARSSYMAAFGGGCARQCGSVVECSGSSR